jgi:hypothetical protein
MKREMIKDKLLKFILWIDEDAFYSDDSANDIVDRFLASHPEPQPQEKECTCGGYPDCICKSVKHWKTGDSVYMKEQKQTVEEILDKYLYSYPWKYESKSNALKAMEEYASQSQSSVFPSEEEIKKEAVWRFTNGHGAEDTYSIDIFINAINWFKSQLPPSYPKEFFIWHIEDANNFFPQRNEKDELVFWDMTQNKGITFDELYSHWLTEINQNKL